ncbi:DUF4180 domain-containing protein [Streptomyces sp. RFCAC02]|uniref:DUF4180 domain-containing protein n=1 Tax=Streptomyces sp. RFCAC02 TaxID=2499143 RepID=UPI00143DED9A|nr:DUF4180 domain-containing protein [Streptomyces sp. RFCAC02]
MTHSAETLLEIHGIPVLDAGGGRQLTDAEAAAEVVGAALGLGAELVIVPVRRLPPAFFDLRTGLADIVTQTFIDYRLRLAYEGAVDAHVARDPAFAEAVRRGNAGRHVWFVPHRAELTERLLRHG